MFILELSIESAISRWRSFIRSSEYAALCEKLRQCVYEDGDYTHVIAERVLSRDTAEAVWSLSLNLDMRRNPYLTKVGTIAHGLDYAKYYLTTPLAAFSVLSMARPMVVRELTDDEIEKFRVYSNADFRDVRVPQYLHTKHVTPYVYKPQAIFLDLFTLKQFLSGERLLEWTNALIDLDAYLLRRSRDKALSVPMRAYYQQLYDSFGARGCTQGQPKLSHNCLERPNEYETDVVEPSARPLLTETARYLAKMYAPRLSAHPEILEHQSTTPIDSAIGNWNYEPNATLQTRVKRMVILGLLGDKYTKFDQVKKIIGAFSTECKRAGYDDFSITRSAGIRVMNKGNKPEFIHDADTPFYAVKPTHATVGVMYRLRLVFSESQFYKALFKKPADILKNISFKLSDIASTDVTLVDNKIREIGRRCNRALLYQVSETGDISCLCATDASGWDRTVAFSLMESSYTFLRAILPRLPQSEYYEILGNASLLVPVTLTSETRDAIIYILNKIVASGESFVTAKNNIVHTIIYYAALHAVTGLSYDEIHRKFESHEWILCVHGDDLLRYLGDDKQLYLDVDKYIAKFGIHNKYEHVPIFLKRFLHPNGELTSDWGSMLKNVKGENPKAYLCVLVIGSISRLRGHLDSHEARRVARVLELMLSYISNVHLSFSNLDSTLAHWSSVLATIQDKLGERALQFRHELETLFYTNGEKMPNEMLDTIYSKMFVDYVNSEIANMYRNAPLERVIEASVREQRAIFDAMRHG